MQSSVVLPSPSPIQSTPPQAKFFPPPVPRFQTNYQKNNSHNIYNATQFRPHTPAQQGVEFDGKRLRKAVVRKTIDYNAASVRQLELRVWQRDRRDVRAIQPDSAYYTQMVPPPFFVHNPINAVTTKFVRTSTNKMRCPIFCVAWTPEGRRLVTGASSGEFTLWNGLTFNFETILQAHDSPVRCMVWSHTDQWMVTGDHAGFVKYWQSNMNNVKMFQAHKEPLRGISFCPTDTKFATCSDDGTVRIWDFLKYHEERILRGHGADVKCVAWHPHKALLVSGSKDSQQPIKLWDPKSGQSLATLHAHKSTVMEAKWNDNGNWLLTGSRDHLIKLFDIRKLSQEVQTFRGHKKEVSSLAWHPVHESLFASGGSDGAVMFWLTGVDKEVGSMEQAHDSIVWSLAWHPLGHILCSGSNDHTCKFWTRNRPGDKMRDKYNLNMMVGGGNPDDISEYDDIATAPSIPGMGLEQNHIIRSIDQMESEYESVAVAAAIPGLDFGSEEPQMQMDRDKNNLQKKIPYSKPIPKQFQQQWMDNKRPLIGAPPSPGNGVVLNQPPPNQGTDGPPPPSMMVPPPPAPHIMNPVPPPSGPPPPQGFVPPQGPPPPPRMGMMWGPRMPGPDGQIRPPPPFPPPPMGNGNQFRPPPNQPPPRFGGDGNQANNVGEANNWKEFGDSDFRVPMDSDLRLLGKGQGPDGQQQHQENNSYSEESRDSNMSGDGQDQDMRSPQDTDARIYQPGSGSANSVPLNDGRPPSSGRRGGRWGPFVGGGGGSPFNTPPPLSSGSNFTNEGDRDLRRGMDGDWDERIGSGMMSNSEGSGGGNMSGPPPSILNQNQPPPPFQGQRKRGWEQGPGIMDMQNQREGGNFSSHQMDDGFSGRGGGGGGMHGFPPPTSQPSNMGGRGGIPPPWGPPPPQRSGGMHGDMRDRGGGGGGGGGWNRGPYRGGARSGRGMRGHN